MNEPVAESEYEDVWVLPFMSQEFNEGPQLHQGPVEVRLRLDHETETGDYVWTGISFRGVQALTFTGHASCSRDQIRAYDRLVRVKRSEWLRSLSGGEPELEHYRIYFDEFGCYDIAASGFEVSGEG